MNIRIVTMTEGRATAAIDSSTVLLCVPEASMMQNTYLPFPRARLYLYHVTENVKEEVAPKIDKYLVTEVVHCENNIKYLYFFGLELESYPRALFMLYRYSLADKKVSMVYRFEDMVKLYESEKRIKLFVLNSTYIYLQTEKKVPTAHSDYRSFRSFECVLMDTKNQISYEVKDPRIVQNGFSQIFPVAEGICAARIGYNLIDEERFRYLGREESAEEMVVLFSVTQFINDISLNIPAVPFEIIDQVRFDKTLSDIRKVGRYLVYGRYDLMHLKNGKLETELFFYQFISKESIMVINRMNRNEGSDVLPAVFHNQPYIIKRGKTTQIYNIRKNQMELKLSANDKVIAAAGNCLLLNHLKHRVFSKKTDGYQELITFPELEELFRTRISLSGKTDQVYALTPDKDTIFLFVSQEEKT